jgi:trehalose/maltose hydrolase-like predicted phosphorylase
MPEKPENYKPWSLSYNDYDPKKEKSRETLLAIGNGYLGTRGAMEEISATETNYPGTYVAGLYNRLVSKVADRDVENEDFVNIPNWLKITFRIDNGNWFAINDCKIFSINRELDLSNGQLCKKMLVEDKTGKQTWIHSFRFASMDNPHIVAMDYRITPVNYEGKIQIKSELDGHIINDGVARYRDLNQKHIEALEQETSSTSAWLKVKTTQSNIEIAEAVKHRATVNGKTLNALEGEVENGRVCAKFEARLKANEEFKVEKIVSIYTSKHDDVKQPLQQCLTDLQPANAYEELLQASTIEWKKNWQKIDMKIDGDTKSQMLVRLHLFHLMIAASPKNTEIDAGIAARGLHGEAYRGHIFWDELYILPLYNLLLPDVARSVLMYRYRRLDKAREYAKNHGYSGAMFPWQSGSDGREETQVIHLNPISGKWGDDYSSLQRHISIAIAYNVWYYFQVTEDVSFMEKYGAELFLEICRFWASKAKKNKNGTYSISNVMGPDEFHETNPNTEGGGLTDNAYTNILVAWLFQKANEIVHKISESSKLSVFESIELSKEELNTWEEIAQQLHIPVSEKGIIEQFEGYFELKELDWDAYKKKYENIYRLDRILKAEGKSPDEYKLAKQADTLMAFYVIDPEDVRTVVEKSSGKSLPDDYLQKNYEYYLQRTSHGSTLSRVVHAYLANKCGNKQNGDALYFDALQSDYSDIQGGTTAEGIHAGVMGATVLMVMKTYAGINFKKDVLEINPALPAKWEKVKFNFGFKSAHYFLEITSNKLIIEIKSEKDDRIGFNFMNKPIFLRANTKQSFNY